MLDLCYSPLVRGSRTRGCAQGAGYNIKHRSNICFNLKINTVQKYVSFCITDNVVDLCYSPLSSIYMSALYEEFRKSEKK